MKKPRENQADRYIDIYLNGITSITNDAGWQGEGMLSLMITFHGQIPHGQRNDQADLTMIHAIDKLRDKHHDFNQIDRIVRQMLGHPTDNGKILSLLAQRYYQGINPATERPYTVEDRLRAINHAPVVKTPQEAGKAWELAKRAFNKRAQAARDIVLERFRTREAA